jgi:histidinol dehydrogenase
MNARADVTPAWRRLDWASLDEAQRRDALARPHPVRDAGQIEAVRAILAAVRARGDRALQDFTHRFDGCALSSFEVGADEFAAAEAEVDADVLAAMRSAIARVEAFHAAQLPHGLRVDTAPGVRCEQVVRAIGRVGLYAPAGSAPLPSTVWMLAVPARLAGCEEIVLATPPRADGRADPAILVAAKLCGVNRVLKLGGAQAIAALAYGSESVPRCDKLFGPGNSWVTLAKLEVAADPDGAAIDMPAGPSEVLVLADDDAVPPFVAADLLAQAEHGADSQVLLVSPSARLIAAVEATVAEQLATLPRRDIAAAALAHARLILVRDLAEAIEVSERYAPEHLIVATHEARALLPRLSRAGSIFLGHYTPETLGDYCAGPNHVLPTLGFARALGGVGVDSFLRRVNVIEADAGGIAAIGPEAAVLARAERLEAHARAVDLRLSSQVAAPCSGASEEAASMLARVRPELAGFTPYASARRSGFEARIRLDANESPWSGDADAAGLNRYPAPQPAALRAQLAALYGVAPEQLWLGRGSDEAIDLLLRAFCRPGRDNVVAPAPTFGMYRIGAQLQGAQYRTLALDPDADFALDPEALLALTDADTKLVIVCSPNNPTGTLYHGELLGELADRLAGRALLLVDEAYVEFAGVPSASALIDRHPNLVVLRTLSKVYALAGARIGALIAAAEIVELVGRIAAPYPLPTPSVHAALAALDDDAVSRTDRRVDVLLAERARVARGLTETVGVRRVWPSAGNFLLVRFADADAAFARALAAGILVRDVSKQPGLRDCLRITIGAPDENDALLAALAGEPA